MACCFGWGSLKQRIDEAENAKLPAFSPDETPKPVSMHGFDKDRLEMIKNFAEQAEQYLKSPASGKMVREKIAAIEKSRALVNEAVAMFETSLDGKTVADANSRETVETRTKTLEAFYAKLGKTKPTQRSADNQLQVFAGRMKEHWGIFGKLSEYLATSKPLSESQKSGWKKRMMNQKLDGIFDPNLRSKMRAAYAEHCDKQRLAELDKYRSEQEQESKRKRAQILDDEANAEAAKMPSVDGDATPAHFVKKQKSEALSSVDVILKTKVGPELGHGGYSVHRDREHMLNELNIVLRAEFRDGHTHPNDVLQTTKLELMWAQRDSMRPHTLALLHKAEQMHYDSLGPATLGPKASPAFFSGALPPTAEPPSATDEGCGAGSSSSYDALRQLVDVEDTHLADASKAAK